MKYLIFPALLGLGVMGCSQSAKEQAATPDSQTATVAPSANTAPLGAMTDTAELATGPDPSVATAASAARLVVYEGKLDLAVDDFETASPRIDSLLEEHGAYLATAHETRTDGQIRQVMTIKVPPTKFVRLVAALGKLGHVENKDVTSADVTADVLAATTALANQQTAQTKYQQLLAKTTNAAEVKRLVAAQHRAQADVTDARTRLQQFGAQGRWATLTLHVRQLLPSAAPSAPVPAFAPQFREAFGQGWSVVMSFLVLLTNLWPLLLVAGVVTGGVRWWRLRHQTPA
ncbi:DUF4349 domain-containing protein [Hymenobacter armeniacus]|uniref:DUF4349 domain-containing protein n=1 Tax=Hymenobacter armeniacus TaxID=2771358 RepID=A0ABR8JQ02_9BACT|nr:DUF4349 domain-containing protein [Hymenobacter armeniacus]MBD2720871.1 DUF4349 domain-containing protein [Hymenobacter armeniacus]